MDFSLFLDGLFAMLALAGVTWVISVFIRDVSIVDSIWSLMFLASAAVMAWQTQHLDMRSVLILTLITVWALRLSIYLTWRNHGQPEDRRYRQIRAKYEPHFQYKSLFIIFLFQAILAWIVSLPLWPALSVQSSFSYWDILAITLWVIGFTFESIADWQLSRFKNDPGNSGKVLRTGLWRYTRHPNYFGECLLWWGFFLFAVNSGAWWTIISPLLMTWLLLKFSGVVMLEETITERRPEYRDYIARTNAFIPGPPTDINKSSSNQEISS